MSDAQIHFPRTTKSGRPRLLHSRKLKNAEAEERVTEPPTGRNVDFFPLQDGSDKMPPLSLNCREVLCLIRTLVGHTACRK